MRQARCQPVDAPRGPRRVAFALCLLLLPASGLPLDNAQRSLDEAAIRLELGGERSLLVLPVVNQGPASGARLRVETLTPQGEVGLSLGRDFTLEAGERPLRVELPARLGRPRGTPQNELLLDRLRFELKTDDGWVTSGVRALSAIVELFELRVTAPHTARSGSRVAVLVLARRVSTGEPLEGVAVEARLSAADEADIARGRTDALGRATLAPRLPADLVGTEHEIRVQGQLGGIGAHAVSELWTRSSLRLLVTTDKPLCQPGQPLRVRLLAFHPRERVAVGLPLSVSLKAPDGESVLERTLLTSDNGVASLEWPIPERAALGDYRLEVRGEEGLDLGAHRTVRVSRYELPAFRLDARSERPFYLPTQREARVIVRVETLTGEPLAGARVTVREGFAEAGDSRVEGETGAAGEAALTVDLAEAHRQLRKTSSGDRGCAATRSGRTASCSICGPGAARRSSRSVSGRGWLLPPRAGPPSSTTTTTPTSWYVCRRRASVFVRSGRAGAAMLELPSGWGYPQLVAGAPILYRLVHLTHCSPRGATPQSVLSRCTGARNSE